METSQYTSEMGVTSWVPQRVLSHQGISWTERKELHLDQTDTAPTNASGFKQTAHKAGLLGAIHKGRLQNLTVFGKNLQVKINSSVRIW